MSVNDLLRDVLCLVQPLVRDNIALSCDLASDLPAVYGDSSQLEQVFVNLIVNALDAMPQGGQLTIATHLTPRNHKVSLEKEPSRPKEEQSVETSPLADTGVGIPSEIQSTIFEPFFTTKPEGKGTGLGLSSAFGIIRQHDGRIEVNSSPGKGAALTVSLPVKKQSHLQSVETP